MGYEDYKVELLEWPIEEDWNRVRERALVTIGFKTFKTPTTEEWIKKMLEARHSPIRCMMFSFYMEIPYWVSTHFVRHVHAQPYISTGRTDRRTDGLDRNDTPQGAIVKMRFDVNAEELQIIMNKRLCMQASEETRYVARHMRDAVIKKCPWMKEVLVPMCVYHGGVCHELYPCHKQDEVKERT